MARSPFLSNCSHQNCDKFSASKPFAVESFCIDCFRLRIFFEVRRGAEGRKGTENGFVCVRHRTKSSLPTFDRRSIELWAGPAGQGVAGGRGRKLAHRYCTGQKEVPCKLRLRESPALGIWNDSQKPEHWCQLPSRGMGRDLAVRQSKRAGFVDHVNAAECRGEEDHLKRSLPYISTVFTRR